MALRRLLRTLYLYYRVKTKSFRTSFKYLWWEAENDDRYQRRIRETR